MNNSILKRIVVAMLMISALFFSINPLMAQFPNRPVSLSVVYSPGGATDFQARIVTMVAAKAEYLGQPIVILNRPGAGGRTGWNHFASRAKTDGYELASYNVPHFIAQSIKVQDKIQY